MTAVSAILKYLSDSNNYDMRDDEDGDECHNTRAKKRRLDHLSWDEKVQRKKLKNRVAAQTSRDRKKARMEQMEQALQELFAKNEQLTEECEKIRTANEALRAENAALHDRLKAPPGYCCSNCASSSQNRSGECETESGSTESPLPRPQGAVTHSAAILQRRSHQQQQLIMVALWKIACLVYLLCRTCSTNSIATSTCTRSSCSRKVSCRISPEIWRRLLKRQIYKNQTLIEKTVSEKWWGRHQKNWNPMDVICH